MWNSFPSGKEFLRYSCGRTTALFTGCFVFAFFFHRDTKQWVLALLLFLENPDRNSTRLLNDIACLFFFPSPSSLTCK